VPFVGKAPFDELAKRVNASTDGRKEATSAPTLEQVIQLIMYDDPFGGSGPMSRTDTDESRQMAGGRKLLQRRGGGRGGGGRGGRAGAVRVGGGGVQRASMGRRGGGGFNRGGGGFNRGGRGFNNFNRPNFGRGRFGRGGILIGGVGGYGGYGGYGGGYGGIGGLGFGGGRAMAYQAPVQVSVPVPNPVMVPVMVPAPVPVAPPVPNNAQIAGSLQGTWRGDGGGAGMGAIVVTVSNNGGSLSMTASPTGCGDCGTGCRWKSATGPVVVSPADGSVTLNAAFASCTDKDKPDSTRGTLSLATNGRNVLYWSPPTHNTQWIKNAR